MEWLGDGTAIEGLYQPQTRLPVRGRNLVRGGSTIGRSANIGGGLLSPKQKNNLSLWLPSTFML